MFRFDEQVSQRTRLLFTYPKTDNLKLFGKTEIFLVEIIMHAWSFGSVANVVVVILSHHSLIWPHHAHYVAQATKIFILPLLINKEKKERRKQKKKKKKKTKEAHNFNDASSSYND